MLNAYKTVVKESIRSGNAYQIKISSTAAGIEFKMAESFAHLASFLGFSFTYCGTDCFRALINLF